MLAVVYLLVFIVAGAFLTDRLLPTSNRLIHLWAGCVLGLLGAMWAPVPFYFAWGITPSAGGAGLALMIVGAWAIARSLPSARPTTWNLREEMPLILTASAFMVMLDVLLYTHVLLPGPGGLHVGQSTFGDLAMHLGMVTSMAYQGQFPPEYSVFPGHLLNYPFLVNSLSAALVQMGLPLRESILIPSYVFAFTITFGFAFLGRELLRCTKAASLAMALFFLNGGFGFLYFLDGAKADPVRFERLFTRFYETPTNLTAEGIYWVNVLVDMLVPQRTTLAGWTVLVFLLWLLTVAMAERRRGLFTLAGIVAGLMPMVHTHSFLGLGIITITWSFALFFAVKPKERKSHLVNWGVFGALAIGIALPQLLFWTFQQAAEGGFVKLHHDWVNRKDPWGWFWTKNVGLPFLLLLPALLAARQRLLWLYTGATAVFVIADFVIFQRNEYDNNKLFYLWFMFTAILVAGYLARNFLFGRPRPERLAVLGLIIFLSTTSAVLSLARELRSSYVLFEEAHVRAAAFIQANTLPDAVFLSSDNHNNAIAALAGRNVYWGTSAYLFFHGVDTQPRERTVRRMVASRDAFKRISPLAGIDYVYISSYERNRLGLTPKLFHGAYPAIYHSDEVSIFAISDAARRFDGRNQEH